jgi:hypothetical protein
MAIRTNAAASLPLGDRYRWRHGRRSGRERPRPAPPELPDIGAALAAFEAWYLAEFGSNYLDILEVEVQELPVVEF